MEKVNSAAMFLDLPHGVSADGRGVLREQVLRRGQVSGGGRGREDEAEAAGEEQAGSG